MARRECKGIGLAHFSAIGVPPAQFVELASGAGFSTVGFRLFPAFPGAPFYRLPDGSRDARDVRARLEGEGVALYDIEFVVIDPAFVPRSTLPVLEDAAALGARRLSVCGDDTNRARLTENFAALCAVAAQVGMGVDLENMGWRPVRAFSDSLTVVEAAGADNGGVLVDALHFFRNGGTVEALAKAPAGRVRGLQLCDATGPGPATDAERIAEARGGRLAPGAGDFPLAALLGSAPDDVVLSVEVPIDGATPPEVHARRLFAGARTVCRRREALVEGARP